MSSPTEKDAIALLRQLFVGSIVSGIRFGSLQLLLSPAFGSGELYINLSSAFQTFASKPDKFPHTESEVANLSEEQEILSLFELRGLEVAQIEVFNPVGHLVVSFSNDAILYINGNNLGPEPWHAGFNAPDRSNSIQIIAISGGKPIVFRPVLSEL